MKNSLKWIAWALASLVVSPLILFVVAARKSATTDSRFQGGAQLLSLFPFKLGTYLRAAYFSHLCPETDREIAVSFMTLLSHRNTQIGKNAYIGPQCNIGKCIIGKDCLFGSGVHVLSGKKQHAFEDINVPIREQGGIYEQITIGENCWIGNNSTIMANVGSSAIIAAGSVVTKDIPANAIAAGNPATVLKSRA